MPCLHHIIDRSCLCSSSNAKSELIPFNLVNSSANPSTKIHTFNIQLAKIKGQHSALYCGVVLECGADKRSRDSCCLLIDVKQGLKN